MRLGPLYHWSPSSRRADIHREGLRPGCVPTICTAAHDRLYLAPDPWSAWTLSGHVSLEVTGMEVAEWDLWQIMELGDQDEVHVRAEFGPRILEVAVCAPVPPQRLRWLGSRGPDVLL